MSQKLEHGSDPRNRMTVDFFIAVTSILNISAWSVIYTYQRFGRTCYTYSGEKNKSCGKKGRQRYRGMVGEHGSYWQPVALKQAQKSSGREKQREILRKKKLLLHHDTDAANYEAIRHHISTVFSDEIGSKYHFLASHISIKHCS
jgi:hypothetical protein